jgi:hypothetical protein
VRDVETLTEVRVEQAPELAPKPVRSATGTHAAVESLTARVDLLEDAVRELSVALKELARRPQSRGL